MASAERPLSPHLQVYRPQWTSVLSISHRATGIVLALGAIVLVWWLAAAAGPLDYYDGFNSYVGSVIGLLALFVWTFCLFYHLGNGIRHLIWDTGRLMELDVAEMSGYAVLAFAAAMTILCWIIGLVAW